MIKLVWLIIFVNCLQSERAVSQDIQPAAQDWSYHWGDISIEQLSDAALWTTVEPVKVPPDRGYHRYLWVKVQLPQHYVNDPALLLYGVDELFELYIDGKKIFQFGDLSQKEKPILGWPWHLVKLEQEQIGKTLYFRIYSASPLIGIDGPIKVGNYKILQQAYIRQYMPQFLVGAVLTFTGLLILLSFLTPYSIPMFFTFGFAATVCGLFSIGVSRIGLLFYDAPLFWLSMERLGVMAVPVSYLCYYEFSFRNKPKLLGLFLIVLHSTYFVGAVVWSIFDSRFLNSGLRPFQSLHVMTLSYVLVSIGIRAVRSKKEDWDSRIFIGGVAVSIILAFNDTLLHMQWGIFRNSIQLSQFGLLITNMSFGTIMMRRVVLNIRQKNRLEKGLADANAVQTALLPSHLSYDDIDVRFHYQAAEKIGGDWFTYHHDSKNNHFYAVIGDVTGHGMASALVTGAVAGTVGAIFRELQKDQSHRSIQEVLSQIINYSNDAVYETGHKADRLMTMTAVGFNMLTGEAWYMNAGHNSFFVISHGKVSEFLSAGTPLGIKSKIATVPKPFKIKCEDYLLLYTDGLIENTGPRGEIFRSMKLIKTLREAPDNLDQIHQHIIVTGQSIWKQSPAEDDMTFLLVHWNRHKENTEKHECAS